MSETVEQTVARDLVFVPQNPQLCITSPKDYDAFYAAVVAECAKFVPDLSTGASRKEIASLAYKVVRSKTAIDDAGKKLTEAWRSEIAKVDETRRKIRNDLDVLAAKVRKPLTDWERAEEERQFRVEVALRQMRLNAQLKHGELSAAIRERIDRLDAVVFPVEDFGENGVVEANAERMNLRGALTMAYDAAVEHERDQAEKAAEIERLRAEEAKQREAVRAANEAAKAAQEEVARLRAEEQRRSHAVQVGDEQAAEPKAVDWSSTPPAVSWKSLPPEVRLRAETALIDLGCDRAMARVIFDAAARGLIPHLKVVL